MRGKEVRVTLKFGLSNWKDWAAFNWAETSDRAGLGLFFLEEHKKYASTLSHVSLKLWYRFSNSQMCILSWYELLQVNSILHLEGSYWQTYLSGKMKNKAKHLSDKKRLSTPSLFMSAALLLFAIDISGWSWNADIFLKLVISLITSFGRDISKACWGPQSGPGVTGTSNRKQR